MLRYLRVCAVRWPRCRSGSATKSACPSSPPGAAPRTGPADTAGAAWFVEVGEARGLDFRNDPGPAKSFFMPQSMGAGAALFDCDGDGRLDKWETYKNGALSLQELDTEGRGRADRRLVYGPDGAFDHMEADLDGSGSFKPLKP